MVLVVEDNQTNARLTQGMLEAAGYRVRVAVDGNEGWLAVGEQLPALIVTDLQMPQLDGLALLRRLKSDPRTENVPVLVLTAHAMQEHRDCALAAGCCMFITKPIRYQAFVASVGVAIHESLMRASHGR
jgi:CheY-like chemotaxis protein